MNLSVKAAIEYLRVTGLAVGMIESLHVSKEHVVLTDHINEWTFNAAGILVATNEG